MLQIKKVFEKGKEESGFSAILAVVVIGALIIIFSSSLTLTTLLAAEAAINNDKSDDIFYLAESGIEDTLRIVLLNPTHDPSGSINTPIGTYTPDINIIDSENNIEKLTVTSSSNNITRTTSVEFIRQTGGAPEVANYAMFSGQELAFLHTANSPQTKGMLRGDLYAKDRIRIVGFILGDSTGATTTNVIAAGSYGSGSQIGSQNDQLYKNSETYYTNMYTLNDVSTHTSAYANNLNIYYRSATQQQINLPSGPNNSTILDPNILVEEINNPEFGFNSACSIQDEETETIYNYSNQAEFLAYITANSGNLHTGIHCIESGNVVISSNTPIVLDGSIITKNGDLTITNNLNLTNSYNLPVLASSGKLILGYSSGNDPAPNNADITGIIYSSGDIYIGNYGREGSATPYFNMVGALWAKANLYVLQSNNIKALSVDITFDPNQTFGVRDFSSQEIDGFILTKWDESYE